MTALASKAALMLLGVLLASLGGFLIYYSYGNGALAPNSIFVEQSATNILFGQTVTFVAYADWTQWDYFNWVLDGELVVVNDFGESSTYTTPANLAVGEHTVECLDYTGQSSGLMYVVVGLGPMVTPSPSAGVFSCSVSPVSVAVVPGVTQTVSLSISGGFPAFTVYWYLDGVVKNTVSVGERVASYTLPSNLAVGSHVLMAEVVDFTQQHAVSNTVSVVVENVLPTPSHSPSGSASPSQLPVSGRWLLAMFLVGLFMFCCGLSLVVYGGLRRG